MPNAKHNSEGFKAFVLLSGGIDSGTALFHAAHQHGPQNVVGVSISYGQRHVKEVFYAQKLCEKIGAQWILKEVDLGLESMLNDPNVELPNADYSELEGVSPTYVPFRNGQLLSIITAEAHMRGRKSEEDETYVYFGAHAEDAHNWAYPDCTPEFVGAMANAIYVGTYRQVRLLTPWQHSLKHQIIQQGAVLGIPYQLTWSCYKGGEKHCGTCPTCRARRQAFQQARVPDPTEYETVISV